MPMRYPPKVMECYVCRDRIKPAAPSPQLCARHYHDIGAALSEVKDLADTLNDQFTAVMKPIYDDRLLTVLVAASDLALPGLHHVKTQQHNDFIKRIEATIAKGDEFGHIVEAWWNARQASVDAQQLAVQIAWMPMDGKNHD